MKKLIILCLALVLVLSMAGCGNKEKDDVGLMPEKNTETPMDKQTFTFNDYNELVSWLQSEDDSSDRKNTLGADYIDYISEIKSTSENKTPLYIPYYGNEIAKLGEKDGFSGITFMTSELYNLPWIWYHVTIGNEDVVIKVACLSQKDFDRVNVQNASTAVKNFSRSAPNTDNYTTKDYYKSITEQTIKFSDKEVSALYIESNDDPRISIQFAYDKTMVIITGNPSVLNSDVLNSLSLAEANEK